MWLFVLLGLSPALAADPPAPVKPRPAEARQTEAEFLKAAPGVGDLLPDVTVHDPSGKEIKTSSLRGHYTVLTFGCLT